MGAGSGAVEVAPGPSVGAGEGAAGVGVDDWHWTVNKASPMARAEAVKRRTVNLMRWSRAAHQLAHMSATMRGLVNCTGHRLRLPAARNDA